MLTRIHGKVQFECDACGDVLDSETDDFIEATGKLKEEGWRTSRERDEWCHYCQECK